MSGQNIVHVFHTGHPYVAKRHQGAPLPPQVQRMIEQQGPGRTEVEVFHQGGQGRQQFAPAPAPAPAPPRQKPPKVDYNKPPKIVYVPVPVSGSQKPPPGPRVVEVPVYKPVPYEGGVPVPIGAPPNPGLYGPLPDAVYGHAPDPGLYGPVPGPVYGHVPDPAYGPVPGPAYGPFPDPAYGPVPGPFY